VEGGAVAKQKTKAAHRAALPKLIELVVHRMSYSIADSLTF
jgi:hypothetical protein